MNVPGSARRAEPIWYFDTNSMIIVVPFLSVGMFAMQVSMRARSIPLRRELWKPLPGILCKCKCKCIYHIYIYIHICVYMYMFIYFLNLNMYMYVDIITYI